MTAPFVLAVPSKGRLQENAEAFFTRAGLSLAKPRGARDYRGTIAGLDNVEIAYLSASDIAGQLARGSVHLGVTGEDLLRESIPDTDRRVALIAVLVAVVAVLATAGTAFLPPEYRPFELPPSITSLINCTDHLRQCWDGCR